MPNFRRLVGLLTVTGVVATLAGCDELDTSFAGDGTVTTEFGSGPAAATGLAIAADGDIVVAGSAGDDLALARYSPDGAPDAGFGTAGTVSTDIVGSAGTGHDVALHATGRIVVVGSAVAGGQTTVVLTRHLADGSLDPTFGSGGVAQTSVAGDALGVAIAPDGGVVVAGCDGDQARVARFLPTGAPDTAFGSGGAAVLPFDPDGSSAADVAIDAGGRIVVVGEADDGRLATARLLADGAPDASFGTGGVVLSDVGEPARGTALALDGDSIVVAGYTTGSPSSAVVARYLGDGSRDTAFGTSGLVVRPVGEGTPATGGPAEAVAVDSAGRTVVVGSDTHPLGADTQVAVMRFLADGRLDRGFSQDGELLFGPALGNDDLGHAVAVDAADNILVAGSTAPEGGGAPAFSVARFLSETPDTTGPPPPEEYVGDLEGFYAVSEPVPAHPPGTLLRYQRVDGVDIGGTTAYRTMYVSRSLTGEPVAVTGSALVPLGAPPPDGRRMLATGHGFTGVADVCAPSRSPQSHELQLMGAFAQAGYLISYTDFEGMGTPGRHPFVVGESEGRGVLDGVRAARQLPDAQAGDRFAITGYSQGGHAALFAGELAQEWAPELEHVGTFAGGPGTEIDVIAQFVPNIAPLAGVFYMAVAGFDAAYADLELSDVLTPAGIESLDVVDEGCAGEVYAYYAGQDPAALLNPDYLTAEPWATYIRASNPGHVTTEAPIYVFHSTQDELLPWQLTQNMVNRMCGNGQTVELVTPAAGGHGPAGVAAYQAAFPWIEGRFDGASAGSSCPGG
jgi:uncharacterized delta-60 repeat protein